MDLDLDSQEELRQRPATMILPKGARGSRLESCASAAAAILLPSINIHMHIHIKDIISMCRDNKSAMGVVGLAPRGGATTAATTATTAVSRLGHYLSALLQPPIRKRDIALASILLFVTFSLILYTTNHQFRRSFDFWRRISPIAAEYKWLSFRHNRLEKRANSNNNNTTNNNSDKEPSKLAFKLAASAKRQRDFHLRTAPKIASLAQDMGGMMIKVGQVVVTMGAAFLEDAYLDALQPLQDGVEPRPYKDIAKIIERSSGKSMHQLFLHFEKTPIGAASIGQVHKATLRTTTAGEQQQQQVVVKVQYPDVADSFQVDFNNIEWAIRFLNPAMMDLHKAVRQRHERELDFTLEADNLRNVAANMQAHGVEPALIRIPRVFNETGLCQKHVLVMEYLEGMPLQQAIAVEQERVAKALGHDSAKEMRSEMRKQMRDYFDKSDNENDNEHDENENDYDNESRRHRSGSDSSNGVIDASKNRMVLQFLSSPMAARLLRFYADAKETVDDAGMFLTTAGAKLARTLQLKGGGDGDAGGGRMLTKTADAGKKQGIRKINLNRAIKVLVHVHGLQMIKDGVYNADPHAGNVLLMPCGRLGLLDYGMVVRLTQDERMNIAQTIVALSNNDKKAAARIYTDGGYKSTWKEGAITDPHVLHRFATWHFDRFDLSPVKSNGTDIDILEMLKSTKETSIPVWVEQARRLNGLLLGVAHQAARPVSLAKEWKSIAHQAVRDNKR